MFKRVGVDPPNLNIIGSWILLLLVGGNTYFLEYIGLEYKACESAKILFCVCQSLSLVLTFVQPTKLQRKT